jgi:hypothetical protein
MATARQETLVNSRADVKILLVAIALLIATIVALITFILSHTSGAHLATATIRSGVAFGGTVPLVLLIMGTAGLL